MDDALVVGRLERLRDRERDAQRLLERNLAARDPRRELLARGQLHHQRALPGVLLQPVDRRDVGVVERGQHLGLALNRPMICGSLVIASGMNLMATSRWSRLSVAR